MADVVTFGEILLRLTPPVGQRFAQAGHFEVHCGGAEANVAVMIAQLGESVAFVTRLPAHELAERAIVELRGLKVDTSHIARGGERMGIYFLEQGASQRPGKVIYDRAQSALAQARVGEFNWEAIFRGAKWFHWSGISPALSEGVAALVAEAGMVAKRCGMTVSFDLNFRAKLWTEARAAEVLTPLMGQVDLCVTSVEEARAVFGLDLAPDAASREEAAAQALVARFGFQTVALTMRRAETAEVAEWGAMLWTGGKGYFSRRHRIAVVDRVGAGDSFSGALIFALRRGDGPEKALEFAVAASALKHTIQGDYNLSTLAEVEALVDGVSGGRVQR